MRTTPPRLLAALQVRVQAALDDRALLLAAAAGALPEVREQIAASKAVMKRLDREVDALLDELSLFRSPFSADMRIQAAWLRHPGTAAVFARHHLPACDRCAVRFEETIGEAAAAYGLDLAGLLEELNGLLNEG